RLDIQPARLPMAIRAHAAAEPPGADALGRVPVDPRHHDRAGHGSGRADRERAPVPDPAVPGPLRGRRSRRGKDDHVPRRRGPLGHGPREVTMVRRALPPLALAALVLACSDSPAGPVRDRDADAGRWATWVLPSGAALRPPPPPAAGSAEAAHDL